MVPGMLDNRLRLTNRIKRIGRARRWIVSGSMALLAVIVFSGSMLAGGWCRADPIVEIDGEEIQVWVAIPNAFQPAVNGPINVMFAQPWDAETEVTFVDAGFNGHGETVQFVNAGTRNSDGSMNVGVWVQVPIDASMLPYGVYEVPVRLEIVTADGTMFVHGSHWWTQGEVTVGG